MSFVRHHRTIAILLAVGFGNSFAFGAVLGLLVPFAVEQLGLTQDDARIGILFSASGLGALLSGLSIGRLYRTERIRWLTPSTLAVSATAIAFLAATARWPGALVAQAVSVRAGYIVSALVMAVTATIAFALLGRRPTTLTG